MSLEIQRTTSDQQKTKNLIRKGVRLVMNNLSIISDEVKSKNLISTKELSVSLGVSERTIRNTVEKLGNDFRKSISETSTGGRPSMMFNEAQATAIKIELQNHSKVAQNGFNSLTISNDLEMLLMQQKLNEYQSMRIAELTKENNMLKPKAEVYDQISESEGLKTIGETAKILGYGEKTLFSILRGNKIFYYDNGVNQVYQRYIDSEYFIVKEKSYIMNNTSRLYTRIFVTAKGLLWLSRILKQEEEVV